MKSLLLTVLFRAFVPCSWAEIRAAQDMAKECRVARSAW